MYFFLTALSVGKEFAGNYGIPEADIVWWATRCGYHTSIHETSSGKTSSSRKCWSVVCRFCRLVLNILLLPSRLLGMLIPNQHFDNYQAYNEHF